MRPMAERSRLRPTTPATSKTARTGISAAPTQRNLAADGRQPGRPGAAARRNAGLYGAPHRSRSTNTARAKTPPPFMTMPARLRHRQNQRSRKMIKHAQQVAVAEHELPPTAAAERSRPTNISRRRRASRSRRSARRWKPPRPCRPPARTAAWPRRTSKSRWAAPPPRPRPIALRRRRTSSSSNPNSAATISSTSLDQLAEVCDAGTRVVVIGRINDVTLYRELTRRGVSDYLIAPVGTIDVVRAVCGLFSPTDAKPVGRMIAVVGAKGGVGASTVAHNVAWAIARDLALDAVVTDLDLAFGTAGLDYNQDPPQGIADAVFSPDRIDTNFVDRLLSKCTDHLSLLAAPATLDRVYDFGAEAFDSILDSLRALDTLRRARRAASMVRLDQAPADQRRRYSRRRRRPISPICATPRTWSICCAPRGRTTAGRIIASTRSACRSGRKSRRRLRQGVGRRAAGGDPVRAATVRHRRQ